MTSEACTNVSAGLSNSTFVHEGDVTGLLSDHQHCQLFRSSKRVEVAVGGEEGCTASEDVIDQHPEFPFRRQPIFQFRPPKAHQQSV